MRHVTVGLLLLLLYPLGAFAAFTSPVVSVLDGATIDVLHNRHAERVRLSGIDCPTIRTARNVIDSMRRD